MKRYIKYRLKTLEPMKLAGQGSQQGTVITRSFIQGSAVRGALIGEFCKQQPDLQIDQSIHLREEFLTGTKFLHAYIAKEEQQITIPVPYVFTASKEELKKSGPINMSNSFGMEKQADKKGQGDEPVKRNEFCSLIDKTKNENDTMFVTEVKKTEYLHVQKAEEKEKESYMFRYEAIASGQNFIGFIQCEEDYVDDFEGLMKKKIFYIGGSKGSGYGKCEITFQEDMSFEEYREQLPVERKEGGFRQKKKLFIYFMSDSILYNQNGMVTNYIEESYLQAALEIQSLRLEKMVCDTSLTCSYNRKHKAHGVQQTAVRAGSVFCYEYKGDLPLEKVMELEEKGVGLRREEGYGQILINPDFSQTLCDCRSCEGNQIKERNEEFQNILNIATEEERNFIQKVCERIVIQKNYDKIVYQLVQQKIDGIKESDWKITRTQGNALKTLLNQIYQTRSIKNYEQDKECIKSFLNEKRNLTSFNATILYESLDEKKPVSVKNFLEKMAQGTASIQEIYKDWNKDKGKFLGDDPRNQMMMDFYDCCLYLKELFRYYLREEA